MIEYFAAGAFTALGILIILVKIGLKRVLYWEIVIDAVLTIGIPFAMAGTYSGMMTAIFAGIWVSVALRTLRRWYRITEPDVFDMMRKKGWFR